MKPACQVPRSRPVATGAGARQASAGFTLVEIMVVISIAGILLAVGLQQFRTMMASTYSRSAAESIFAGLQLARAEAIRRNAPMRFQLVSTLTSACAYSATSALWVVSQTDQGTRGQVAGYCDASAFLPPDQLDPCSPDAGICPALPTPQPANCRPIGNPASCSNDPWIAFKSAPTTVTGLTISAKVSSASATAASIVTFGPLGQVLENITPGSNPTLGYILVTPDVSDAKKWAVRIDSINGSLKLCDPEPVDPSSRMVCT